MIELMTSQILFSPRCPATDRGRNGSCYRFLLVSLVEKPTLYAGVERMKRMQHYERKENYV
jgi:hypothetical protein